MFYEADLHTDRVSANRQRQVAWSYRQQEFCPSEVLPGFAFHQTDRAVTKAQARVCPDGRCSNASRSRGVVTMEGSVSSAKRQRLADSPSAATLAALDATSGGISAACPGEIVQRYHSP